MSLEAIEQDKYERMWSRKEYRRWSPGLEAAPRAWLHMERGQSLYDLGCGTGRAGVWFAGRGMDVALVDFVPSAVEYQSLPFFEACLWEMSLPRRDWGFCADVMEHIPSGHVDETLKRIASVCTRAYLQIHCHADGCGRLIGETLHMTVREPNWWLDRVDRFFDVTHVTESSGHVELIGGSRG